MCIQMFEQWSEADQVEFVEHLISRMCHYQHGHINSYLKPMLQRDFITALPGTHTHIHPHNSLTLIPWYKEISKAPFEVQTYTYCYILLLQGNFLILL